MMQEFRRITFNGIEMWRFSKRGGPDHPIAQEVEGLLDGPTWETASGDRAGADGAWSGTPRRKARAGSITGVTFSADEMTSEQWGDQLIAAGIGKDLPLTFHFASGPRTLLVRVDGAIKRKHRGDSCAWQIPLVADDPSFYLGDGVSPAWSGTTGRARESGGVMFPLTFPLAWAGDVVGGQLEYRNPGTTGRLDLRIDGPVVDPVVKIRNGDGTRVLSWALTLAAGEFLAIEPQRRRAMLQGEASRPPVQRGWPRLAPGGNQFQFHAGGDSTGTLTVSAWPAY